VSKVIGAAPRTLAARNMMSWGKAPGGSRKGSPRDALKRLLLRSGPVNAEASVLAARFANRVREISQRIDSVLKEQVEIELQRFYGRLVSSADRVSLRLDSVDQDPDVRFALEELGPQRIEAAAESLSPCSAQDYVSLRDFLADVADGVDYDVDQADEAADVGDALLRGLDNLNGFLLSQDLVGPSYRRAQDQSSPVVFRSVNVAGRRPNWQPRPSATSHGRVGRFTRDDGKHRVRVS
jgi:hypothetical protein